MSEMEYHNPVMVNECLQGLQVKPNGIYVDLTFGGGGHSRAILDQMDGGNLYAFDQDQDAANKAVEIGASSFTFIQSNFRYLKKFLKFYKVEHVDGILADLGISSHQIDRGERGFSTRFDADLDMRMDQKSVVSARKILNEYEMRDLEIIFRDYGEFRNGRKMAAAIDNARRTGKIETTFDLKAALKEFETPRTPHKYWARVFQALRIEVNDEMDALKEMLSQTVEVLKPGGRLVVMSYHSLEDRLVKNFINKGNFSGVDEKDFYGNLLRPLEPVNRKPFTASQDEISKNKRARSAKLRIATKKEGYGK